MEPAPMSPHAVGDGIEQPVTPECVKGNEKSLADIPRAEVDVALTPSAGKIVGHVKTRITPSLNGRSPEIVSGEAARIRMGEIFPSFHEFDRCLDSWAVENGRSSHRLATKSDKAVRVCRFGGTVRKKPSYTTPPVPLNLPPRKRLRPDDHSPDEDQENMLLHGQAHRNIPMPGDHNPLAPTNTNTVEGVALGENPQPNSSVDLPTPTSSSRQGRKVSQNGACGQFSRFLSEKETELIHNCPFRVRATKHMKTGIISITVCELNHTCPQDKHMWRGPTTKSTWLAETLADRVVQNVKVPVNDILAGFTTDYKKTASYHQAWRAKDRVKDQYLGGQLESSKT